MVVAVRVGLVGVAGLCVSMAGAHRAGAASAERTFHVEYEAGAACPGEAWFAEAVSSRAAGAQCVEEAEAAIRFRVELRAGTSALWVMLGEGRSRREFSGDSCADVAEAMVLVAAPAPLRSGFPPATSGSASIETPLNLGGSAFGFVSSFVSFALQTDCPVRGCGFDLLDLTA